MVIVISNFCSEDVIENHIKIMLKVHHLAKALKKIKLSRFIYVSNNKNNIKYLFNNYSPHMGAKNNHTKLNYYKD